MNSFLFFFILFVLVLCYLAVRNYGMTEEFLSNFSKEELSNIKYDIHKNAFVQMRWQDFHHCSVGRGPQPIKSNFV